MCNRKAFAELYADQAVELTEKMACLRSKEAGACNFNPSTLTICSCVCNRKAFAKLYAGQAGELAEKMARLRY